MKRMAIVAAWAVVAVVGGMGSLARGQQGEAPRKEPAAAAPAATSPAASSPAVLLEKGIYNEETAGDLDAAIKVYQQIVGDAKANRQYVAQAQYRLGACYLKKKQSAEAIKSFKELTAAFADQKELVEKAREQIAKAKDGMGDPEIGKVVDGVVTDISTMADGDPRIPGLLQSLRELREPAVVKSLVYYFHSDKNTVRRAALYVLWKGEFADASPAVPGLIELCRHEEEFTRGMAALALGAIKAQAAFDALATMTATDRSPYARRCAAYALGLLGDQRAKPVLEKALKDPDKNVSNNAEAALTMLAKAGAASSASPRVVKTNPTTFDRNVDPSLDKITVTFDRPMLDKSWSFTGGDKAFGEQTGTIFPERAGEIAYDAGRTICTMPVKLQPGKVYWVGVNSPSFRNFKSADGVPAQRYLILFATRSADGKPTPLPEDLVKEAEQTNSGRSLAPGDAIDVTVQGLIEPDLLTVLRRMVSPEGFITLPNLKQQITANGMTPAALARQISSLYDGKTTNVVVIQRAREINAAGPQEAVREAAGQFLSALRDKDLEKMKAWSLGSVRGWLTDEQSGQPGIGQLPGLSERRLSKVIREMHEDVYKGRPELLTKIDDIAASGDYAAVKVSVPGAQDYMVWLFVRTVQGWRFVTADDAREPLAAELDKHAARLKELLGTGSASHVSDAKKAAEEFLAAVRAGDTPKASKLVAPGSAVAKQLGELPRFLGDLTISGVFAGEPKALVITCDIPGDRKDRRGPLLIRLVRQGDQWLVEDIDMETPDGARKKLTEFLTGSDPLGAAFAVANTFFTAMARGDADSALKLVSKDLNERAQELSKLAKAMECPDARPVGMALYADYSARVAFGPARIKASGVTFYLCLKLARSGPSGEVWSVNHAECIEGTKDVDRFIFGAQASTLITGPSAADAGEFYVMGKVQRPGVYSMTGRKVTIKMALAAAGAEEGKEWPEKGALIRRTGESQEEVIPLNIKDIVTAKEKDLFLHPNDVIAVGLEIDAARKLMPILTGPLSDGRKESSALGFAGAELLGDFVIAQSKKGQMPEGATTAEFLPRFFEGLKATYPGLLLVTPEQEKRFADGQFDNVANKRRAAAAVKALADRKAVLPQFAQFLADRADKLDGAKLEFAVRLLESVARKASSSEASGSVSPADKKAAEELAAEGWRLVQERKLPEAEAKLQAAVAKDPTSAEAWNKLGWAQVHQGKPVNAKEAFTKAVALDPKNAGGLNGLAWVAKSEGKTDEAIELWKKSLAAAPTGTLAMGGLGETYAEQGLYDKAVEQYRAWLKIEPDKDATAGLEKAQADDKALLAGVQGWLGLLDSGEYVKAWESAGPLLRTIVDDKNQWAKVMTAVRGDLGKIKGRKLDTRQLLASIPGFAGGPFLVLRYDSTFEKKHVFENVVVQKGAVGAWGVVGYTIAPFGVEMTMSGTATIVSGVDVPKETTAAAEQWLKLIDGGDYDKSHDQAAAFFRKAVAKDEWARQVKNARAPLGQFKTRKMLDAAMVSPGPNEPPSKDCLMLEYEAEFVKRDKVVEMVSLRKEADGTWRVAGYFIR